MTIGDIINTLGNILDMLLPFLIALGVIIFVWGVVQYVIASDEEAKTRGKNRMMYGIIGVVAIVGLWGLVTIVINTFGLDNSLPANLVPLTPQLVGGCNSSVKDISYIICRLSSILNQIIPFLIGVGALIFVWGVVAYVIGNDEEAKTRGRDRIIFGIIGLAVIASLWGLVNVVVSTLNIDTTGGGVASQFINSTSALGSNSNGCNGLPASGAKLGDLFGYATCLITKSVIPLIFALAVLIFVWGIMQYVISAGNEEQKDRGRQYMIWGIIALTVMVSVWGIAQIVGSTFNIDYNIPQVKSQ